MYSILLKGTDGKYSYYQAEEGVNFAGTLAEAKAEYVALLKKGTSANSIVVVHNTLVDLTSIGIADVTE